MSLARRASQLFARIGSPALHSVGLGRALSAIQTYSAFVGGQGAGAGWDHANEIAAVAGLVRGDRPVIFDVGANDGTWALDLSTKLGRSDARFLLFECAPYCFPGIDQRIGGIANPTLIKAAVSDQAGTAVLNLPTRGSGLASLHERRDVCIVQEDYVTLEVPTVTLDSVAEESGIGSIALLKLDIEGHELFVLKGATRLLTERRIRALTFEFGSGNVNSRTFFRDFWELLTPLGYRLHRILPGGALTPVDSYSETLEYFRGATNYVAELA